MRLPFVAHAFLRRDRSESDIIAPGWADPTKPAMASTTPNTKAGFINAAAPPSPPVPSQKDSGIPSSTETVENETPPTANATPAGEDIPADAAASISATITETASTEVSSITAPATAVQTDHQIEEPTSSSGGLSTTTKIAIAVPVSVVGLTLLLALTFFLVRRRRRNKNRTSQPPPYQVGEWSVPMPSTQKLVNPTPNPPPEPVQPRSPPVGTLQVPETSISRAGSQRTLSGVSDISGHSLGSPDLGDEAVEFGTAIRVQVNSRRYSANKEDLVAGRPSRLFPRASETSSNGQTRAGDDRRQDHDAIPEVSAPGNETGRRGGRRGFGESSESSEHMSPASPSSERRFV